MKQALSLAIAAVLLLAGCSPASPPTESVSTPLPSPPPVEDQPVFVPTEIPEPEPDPRQETINGLLAAMTP